MIADDNEVRIARSEYLQRLATWAATNKQFLNIVYQQLVATDDWPDIARVQRRREAEGLDDLDLIDVSFQIPHPLGHRDPSSDKVVLTIRGIANCDSAAEVLQNFAHAVTLSYRIWTQTGDLPATLSRKSLEGELNLSGSRLDDLDRILRRTYLPFGGLSVSGDGHWELSIHDTIRKFKNTVTIDDYLRTEAELVIDRFSLARAGLWNPQRPAAASPVSTVGSARRASQLKWDVFICHATEDKVAIADRVAAGLQAAGVKVWYDRFELRVGDSLRQKIDEGLSRSRLGIVILSHSFFAKQWPQSELDGLVSKEANGRKVILPIWFGLSRAEVTSYSPLLAGRLAAKWEDGATTVVDQLLAAIN